MFRLIGILSGSVIATAILLAVVDDPTLEHLRRGSKQVVGYVAERIPPQVMHQIEHGQQGGQAHTGSLAAQEDSPSAPVPHDEQAPGETTAMPQHTPEVGEPEPEFGIEQPSADDEPKWHAFWHPFRHKTSALGFIERLRRLTDLDYLVLEVAPGKYRVAFAYRDEVEKQAHLHKIEAATGLKLEQEQ